MILLGVQHLLKLHNSKDSNEEIYRCTKRIVDLCLYSKWQQGTEIELLHAVLDRGEKDVKQMFDAPEPVNPIEHKDEHEQKDRPPVGIKKRIQVVIEHVVAKKEPNEKRITFEDYQFALQHLLIDYSFIQTLNQQVYNLAMTALAGVVAGAVIASA